MVFFYCIFIHLFIFFKHWFTARSSSVNTAYLAHFRLRSGQSSLFRFRCLSSSHFQLSFLISQVIGLWVIGAWCECGCVRWSLKSGAVSSAAVCSVCSFVRWLAGCVGS
ncbi:hypothetical protein Pint_36282 [Pistacia integerrima]|uniref:Uncharacterized protein n=1 Tax=Pistacia integerrima TaxID=434235 RepID=A0ACC0Y3L7_9ROSI|nr:hypothetical protein Pint_36282 [Pistacia integerrima]